VFHVLAIYYTKTLITNKCTKRVLSSIVTHSYMFRPCWVVFREHFSLPLHSGCTLQLSQNVLLTVYLVVKSTKESRPNTPGSYCVAFTEEIKILNIKILRYIKLITINLQCCNINGTESIQNSRSGCCSCLQLCGSCVPTSMFIVCGDLIMVERLMYVLFSGEVRCRVFYNS
jgi:hypothetical protein